MKAQLTTHRRPHPAGDSVNVTLNLLGKLVEQSIGSWLYSYRHMNPRIKRILKIQSVVFLSLIALWVFAAALMNHITWVNRPTLAQRLAAPYALEMRPLAPVSLSGSLLPEAVSPYAPLAETGSLSLLTQCMMDTIAAVRSVCTAVPSAGLAQSAGYQAAENSAVTITAVQLTDEAAARAYISGLYSYSRSVGRTWDFSLVGSQTVNYYYSSVRDAFSFTWMHGTTVYSATAASPEVVENFVKAFPY